MAENSRTLQGGGQIGRSPSAPCGGGRHSPCVEEGRAEPSTVDLGAVLSHLGFGVQRLLGSGWSASSLRPLQAHPQGCSVPFPSRLFFPLHLIYL